VEGTMKKIIIVMKYRRYFLVVTGIMRLAGNYLLAVVGSGHFH
jgi:DNA polymerase III alpha subunit